MNNENKQQTPATPSPLFSLGAFILGLALAAGASYCMDKTSTKTQKTCPQNYPATLEAICQNN